MVNFLSLCMVFFLPVIVVQGQVSDTTTLVVNKTTDFEISGDGQASNWQNEKWLLLPKRNKGGADYQTKMKILYSDSGIYNLFYCEDTLLTSTLREDFSDLFNEDVVEAFFWTDEKVTVYFEYELSPFNFELPILVPNTKGYYLGWRPWHYENGRKTRHATHVYKNNNRITGWSAEFFVPYKLLKPLTNVPPVKGTRWRANFYRMDYDNNNRVSDWSWQLTRTDFHDYERFGTLLFN